MSFLFPRTISITRPNHQAVGDDGDPAPIGGVQGYGGMDQAEVAEVASGIAASIQEKGTGRANETGLPGDTVAYRWAILIPDGLVAAGVIKDRDLVEDDLGRRFQVEADYAHSMGWTLKAARLEP